MTVRPSQATPSYPQSPKAPSNQPKTPSNHQPTNYICSIWGLVGGMGWDLTVTKILISVARALKLPTGTEFGKKNFLLSTHLIDSLNQATY